MKSRLLAFLLLLLAPTAGRAAFTVSSPTVKGDGNAYLSPSFAGWQQVPPRRLLLKETPRIYATDPVSEASPPAATVRSVRAEGRLYLLLEWEQSAPHRDRPAQTPKPELQKNGLERAQGVEVFADAACCQYPEKPSAVYPSPMMGAANTPVRIAFWKAGLGFSGLRGKGRQAVEKDPNFAVRGDAVYEAGRWRVAFQIPGEPAFSRTLPVSFAIWDGGRLHRNGRKFFTPWYDLELK